MSTCSSANSPPEKGPAVRSGWDFRMLAISSCDGEMKCNCSLGSSTGFPKLELQEISSAGAVLESWANTRGVRVKTAVQRASRIAREKPERGLFITPL